MMRLLLTPSRILGALLLMSAWGLASHAQSAIDSPDALQIRADEVRADLLRQINAQRQTPEEDHTNDPLGRTRGEVGVGAINPSLRLEYASASRGIVDPNVAFDGLSATRRAELGLADSDTGRLYDAGLRFDAARIGDVALTLRSGVRGAVDTTTPGDGSPLGALLWNPVAGAGLEWRPLRDFYLSGATLFNVDDRRGTLAELTAELGMRVTPDMSVSLGYRTLESNFTAPSDAAEDLRDAAFAAIRLRF